MADGALLVMRGIRKTFGPFTALDGIDLALERGRVRALVGENGAGKSTLIKVMTGAYRRDAGTMTLEGRPVDFRSPQEAQANGVVAVYQEVNLLPHRTVAENVLLGREPCRWGLLDRRQLRSQARAVIARMGVPIEPDAVLGELNIALRQMVAIARGVSLGARVLVLDEPTSSLSGREVAALFEVVRRLKAEGITVVYISHRFDELYAVCDDVTVLRDGRLVVTRPLAGLERLDLVALMLGKRREELRQGATALRRHEAALTGPPLLRGQDLKHGRKLNGVTVEVRRGETVGVAGLLGSGRTELARVLFGADPRDSGEVHFEGAPLNPRSPRDAMAAGMAFLSEDRKAEGIIPELSVRENLTLAALAGLSRLGVVSRARQRAVVEHFMARLRIKGSAEQKVRELSGGNQQKVLLARWLCRGPKLLILDEPTRGIDIGARGEIQALVSELADAGLALLLISSELEELIEGCTRLLVLRDGCNAAELRGVEISEPRILQAMAGLPPGKGGAGP